MRLRAILSHATVPRNLHFLLGSYQYSPLPSRTSIRLLELISSDDRRVVQCRLKTFELDDAPQFRALSYTWGDPLVRLKTRAASPKNIGTSNATSDAFPGEVDDKYSSSNVESRSSEISRRHSIICDGRILKVTANLKDALRMLTSLHKSRNPSPTYYWIDALCMDQQNVLERNAQVAKMAEIYMKAQSVIVWLGKEDEHTKDAITTIERVSAIPQDVWSYIPYTAFYDPSQAGSYLPPNLSYHHWLGFLALINRPWFKRAWVSLRRLSPISAKARRSYRSLHSREQLL
jgi:hypothetical protein